SAASHGPEWDLDGKLGSANPILQIPKLQRAAGIDGCRDTTAEPVPNVSGCSGSVSDGQAPLPTGLLEMQSLRQAISRLQSAAFQCRSLHGGGIADEEKVPALG